MWSQPKQAFGLKQNSQFKAQKKDLHCVKASLLEQTDRLHFRAGIHRWLLTCLTRCLWICRPKGATIAVSVTMLRAVFLYDK